VRLVLRQMVRTGQVPNALLFCGSRGTGKTTTARVLAAALNANIDGDVDLESEVAQAVLDGRSTDVIELDAASNGGVDSVREIRDLVQYEAQGWRVVILDEAHSMTREAFNALLKTLEEPPPRTVFVLVTTEPHRILETVRSRCMEFTFSRLSEEDIFQRLVEVTTTEGMDTTEDLLRHLAGLVEGAMRDALMLLEQCQIVGITTVEGWQEFSGALDMAPAILMACVRGDLAGAFEAVATALQTTGDVTGLVDELVTTLRDVTLIQAGSEVSHRGQAFTDRQALATEIEPLRLLRSFRVLWGLRSGLRVGSGRREEVELCVAVLTDVLAVSPQHFQPQGPPPDQVQLKGEPLSLSDMKATV